MSSQRAEIIARTASLTVEAKPKNGRVVINHREVGTTPIRDLRLPAGTYDIEVIPQDGFAMKRSITMPTGLHSEVFDENAEPKPDAPYDLRSTEVVPIPRKPKPTPIMRPLALATGIGAGVFAVTGFAMVGWMNLSLIHI